MVSSTENYLAPGMLRETDDSVADEFRVLDTDASGTALPKMNSMEGRELLLSSSAAAGRVTMVKYTFSISTFKDDLCKPMRREK